MQEESLSELDRRILNALQISPRARWTHLAPILNADAATLQRRWSELVDRGLAWITSYDQGAWQAAAIVELNCRSGHNVEVATELAEQAEVLAVDLTAGARDIVATIAAPSHDELGGYLLEKLPQSDGIVSVRSHPIANTIIDGRSWRVRALDAQESERIAALPAPSAGRGSARDPELERRLVAALADDGRASASHLAQRLGEHPRHVRELLGSTWGRTSLMQRTDVTRAASGWPVSAWYFLRVPASRIDSVAARIGHLDEVRLISHSVGPYDLIMNVWLKNLADIRRLEEQLEARLPGVQTVDRSVSLRTVKHLGRILDNDGRSSGRSRL